MKSEKLLISWVWSLCEVVIFFLNDLQGVYLGTSLDTDFFVVVFLFYHSSKKLGSQANW